MRVVMISKACVVAPYRATLEELAKLPEMDLHLLVPPCWRSGGTDQVLEPGYDQGYELITTPIWFNGNFHLHFYPELGRHLRRLRPDIVHMDEEPYNLATWLAMRSAKAVGSQALFFTWQNIARSYPLPFRAMERANYVRADYALAGNAEAARVLRAKGYAGALAVIPQFGVDPDFYRPRPSPAQKGQALVIGYAGRLVPEKGVHDLLRAAAGLSGQWRIEILGSGPEGEALVALARDLGVADRIRFRGGVPAGEVPAFLNSLDVLALPSRTMPNWKEQFGRILVEAMACQVPVIGSSSGEIPNVIGEGGLVFPEGDVEALGACLAAVRDEPDPLARWGVPGRERVLAQYTQARIAARTYKVYREMVGQG